VAGDVADAGYRAAMDYHVADMEKAIRQLGLGAPREGLDQRQFLLQVDDN
jgi:hypothetical protein